MEPHLALELLVAAFSAFNALYFLVYVLGAKEKAPYRIAAAALLLVCLGPLVESAFSIVVRPSYSWWPQIRVPTLLGMGAISLLILRRTFSLRT